MSQYLRILCRSERPLPRSEIGNFIHEGWFFNAPPRFEPMLDATESAHLEWTRFEVHPTGAGRPIVLHYATQDVLANSIAEIIQTLLDAGLEASHAALLQRIRASRQLITIEIEPLRMTDDDWEMLNATEAFVARSRDGVVFVSGEGVYDAALQPLCILKPREHERTPASANR